MTVSTPTGNLRTPQAPPGQAPGSGGHAKRRPLAPYLLTFCVSFATWLVLSGKFDTFHLSLGVVACLIVAYCSGDMLLATTDLRSLPGQWYRFAIYIPWLLYQIFVANIHVMRLVFHPRMLQLIDPQIIRFQTRLRSEMARFVLANSITLTPGTITVYVSVIGTFTVHAIDEECARALPGEMEAKVAAIFGE